MAPGKYDPVAAGAACHLCPLRGKTVVPPEGHLGTALLALVGETPGFVEERQGKPFVGPSGMALAEILDAVGIRRDQLWISNTILCRPEVPGMVGKKQYDFKTYLAAIRAENARRKKEAKAQGTEFSPIASPIDCCSVRLGTELAALENAALARGQPNGAVIVPLGNFALEAITGQKGIMKRRGSILSALMFPNPDLELDKRGFSRGDQQ